MDQKTSESPDESEKEEKVGDNPPEQKRQEAKNREGRTFSGDGVEKRGGSK